MWAYIKLKAAEIPFKLNQDSYVLLCFLIAYCNILHTLHTVKN